MCAKSLKVIHPDPAQEAQPIDEVEGEAIQPTDPQVITALDDDEGGADAIDPTTGRPYDNKDAGAVLPVVGRDGGTEDSSADEE